MQIKDGRLRFRFNLNSLRTEERDLWLTAVTVNDGQWHTVKVSRYGSSAVLELDGGEGRRYNETFHFEGHQWMQVDKQEGVYAGGKAEYTGVRSYEVYGDYQKGNFTRQLSAPIRIAPISWEMSNNHDEMSEWGPTGCLDDIRLMSKPLPLPPALNGTQWGQATTSNGVRRNCPSNNPCANVICPPPFECNDLWMDYECRYNFRSVGQQQ